MSGVFKIRQADGQRRGIQFGDFAADGIPQRIAEDERIFIVLKASRLLPVNLKGDHSVMNRFDVSLVDNRQTFINIHEIYVAAAVGDVFEIVKDLLLSVHRDLL